MERGYMTTVIAHSEASVGHGSRLVELFNIQGNQAGQIAPLRVNFATLSPSTFYA
jgi:hypothetical protein